MSVVELEYLGEKTAEHYFSKIRQLKYSLLFTSSIGEQSSQFDIILAAPNTVLKSYSSPTVSHQQVSLTDSNWIKNTLLDELLKPIENPHQLINDWLRQYHLSHEAIKPRFRKLPFLGGVAGAFSYDFGRQIEKIPTTAENDLVLPDFVAGIYFCPLLIDHSAQKTFLLNLFNKTELFDWLFHRYSSPTASEQDLASFRLDSEWQSNMSKSEYSKKFSQVKDYIKSGDCYQINLAQRFKANYQGDAWQAFCFLNKLNQSPFSGYFNLGDSEILSLSPERFIQINGDNIITQPIKGTRPRGETAQQDKENADNLLNSEKDKSENLMIVDLLRNDLGKSAAAGSVKVSELFGLYSFNSVHHLISTIEAKLSPNKSHFDVFISAFPGGSITGAPKVRAMEIIEELEPHRRSFYCGSLAYFSFHNNSDSNIMIRTLIAHNHSLYTWAGGGLVDDSMCDDEYDETFAKLSKILTPLSQLR